VVSRLWEVKKQTTTGVCECVSLAAPALGGGHGYLQGQRGLVADQLVSARVVLADGRVVTASSDTGNGGDGDLFWAIKGAGHNFGVVTEMVFKVYDVVKPEWAYEYLFFTGDKVGELYQVANAMLETQAAEAVLWTTWVRMPDVDPINVSVPKLDWLTLWGKGTNRSSPSSSYSQLTTAQQTLSSTGSNRFTPSVLTTTLPESPRTTSLLPLPALVSTATTARNKLLSRSIPRMFPSTMSTLLKRGMTFSTI